MYERPKESPDEYHPIYNGVVAWLDAEAPGPGSLTAKDNHSAPQRRLNRQARAQTGKQRRPTKPPAPVD